MLSTLQVKAVFAFVKKNWKEFLIVAVLCALWGKTQMDYQRLQEAYAVSEQSLRNQLTEMRSFHAEELRLRDEALQGYQETIANLEEQYEKDRQDLDESREANRAEIVEEITSRSQFSENRNELAAKIEETFGFEYVP
jgi:DNA anti-recombination protein RmuC